MKNRFINSLVVFFIIISSLSCTNNSKDSNSSPSTVSIASMQFTPASLTVTVGTTVTWTNNDNVVHTVTSTSSIFDSGNLAVGSAFSYKFTTAGVFTYKCTIHPGMTGTIIVN